MLLISRDPDQRKGKILNVRKELINLPQPNFYSTPYRRRVYKWKFCLFVCPSSLLILFLIQTLSSRNLPQSTLVTQPLPRYPKSPIPVSHARQSTGPPSQSTGPPMNIPIWGRVMCQLDIFCSCFWIHIQKSSSVSKNITLSFTQFFCIIHIFL